MNMPSLWSLLSNRGQHDVLSLASVFARNAIPVVGIIWFGWSGVTFLLLAEFNFALSLALSGVSPATASTLIQAQRNGKPVSRVGIGIQAVAITAVLSSLLTAMIGWPIVVQSTEPVFDRGLWLAVAVTLITLLPGVLADVRALAAAGLSDEKLKAVTQQRAALSIFSIIPIAMTWTIIGDSRSIGTLIAVVVVTAFSIVRDMRPDLVAELGSKRPPSDSAGSFAVIDDTATRIAVEREHRRKREHAQRDCDG